MIIHPAGGRFVAAKRKKGQRLVGGARDDLRQTLVTEYEAGRSIRDLAVAHDISIGLSRNLLVESGVVLRRRGGATRKKADL